MNAVDAALHRNDPRTGDPQTDLRHDWTRAEIRALFELPFPELIFRAQSVHRLRFDPPRAPVSAQGARSNVALLSGQCSPAAHACRPDIKPGRRLAGRGTLVHRSQHAHPKIRCKNVFSDCWHSRHSGFFHS